MAAVEYRQAQQIREVFARRGCEYLFIGKRFEDAWQRRIEVEGFPVCHIDDIIASKEATGRQNDREPLPRLRSFREHWVHEKKW